MVITDIKFPKRQGGENKNKIWIDLMKIRKLATYCTLVFVSVAE